MSTLDLVTPRTVIDESGNVKNVAADYDDKRKYPGQDKPCPVCGAEAIDAPEGIYGFERKVDKSHNHGDPVWEFEHCWKCGYRGGAPVQDVTSLFEQFKAFIADKMKDDVNHPTVNYNKQLEAENASLRAEMDKLKAVFSQAGSAPAVTPGSTDFSKGDQKTQAPQPASQTAEQYLQQQEQQSGGAS